MWDVSHVYLQFINIQIVRFFFFVSGIGSPFQWRSSCGKLMSSSRAGTFILKFMIHSFLTTTKNASKQIIVFYYSVPSCNLVKTQTRCSFPLRCPKQINTNGVLLLLFTVFTPIQFRYANFLHEPCYHFMRYIKTGNSEN